MRSNIKKLVLVGLMLVLSPMAAYAYPISFDLIVTITETNASVGTGVVAGDVFTGVMFFDSADLAPDGSRSRTILPGGDTITIAGITFDTTLVDTFYVFGFSGGMPLCIGDFLLDGCGTGEGQSIPKLDGDDLIFYDNGFGVVRDSISGEPDGPFQFADFSYSFAASSVPEPGTLALLGIGLLGMGAARRRKKA